MIPSIEAVQYGRSVISVQVDQLTRFEEIAWQQGRTEAQLHYQRTRRTLERLLGDDGEDGCRVAAFDERWLDPSFRSTMGGTE